MHTRMYNTAELYMYARYVLQCRNPDVEFTVFKIVLWNFDHAWDQVYNKKQNWLQG